MATIFGKIIEGQLPAEKVYENDKLIVIKDINPIAPIHLLIIPKKEIVCLQNLSLPTDSDIIIEVIRIAQQLAKDFGVENGYRLLVNNGHEAGQTVFHLHFHLIAGRQLNEMG